MGSCMGSLHWRGLLSVTWKKIYFTLDKSVIQFVFTANRCTPVLKEISCWRQQLSSIPAAQSVPNDINHMWDWLNFGHPIFFQQFSALYILFSPHSQLLFIYWIAIPFYFLFHLFSHFIHPFAVSDLSFNHLRTLHKDTFRGLTHLTLLDLSRNRLDFLPNDLLLDLDSLSNL